MDRGERRRDFDVEYPVTSEVGQRIRSILSEAEAAGSAIRHEAEQYSQKRRRAAEDEAREIVNAARREADEIVAERIRRMSELSDLLWTRAEGLVGRFEQAEEMRRQLGDLIDALGGTAGELARQANLSHGPAADPQVPAREPEPEPEPEPVRPAATAPPPVADESSRAAAAEEPVDAEVVPDAGEDPEVRRQSELRVVPGTGEAGTPAPDADGEVAAAGGGSDDDHLAARLVALQMAVAGGNRAEVEGHLRRAFELPSPESILDDIFGSGTGPETRVAWPEPAGKGSAG